MKPVSEYKLIDIIETAKYYGLSKDESLSMLKSYYCDFFLSREDLEAVMTLAAFLIIREVIIKAFEEKGDSEE